MATRKVILTERELTSLIKRIIRETEEMDMENEGGEMSKKEVVGAISDFFKQEVLPELSSSEKRKLKMKVDGSSSKSLGERELEEDEDIKDRMSNFKEKLMMRGGAAMTAAGILGYIGSVMGWSEFETTTKIHEFVEQFGAGNYAGPITVAMIAAGLTLAFKGRSDSYRRTGK